MSLSCFYDTVYSPGVIGTLGAIGAKAGEEISKRIGPFNPLKIVDRMIPDCIKNKIKEGTLNQSLQWCNTKVAKLLNSYQKSSVIGAPLLEETVFRAGIQTLLTILLITSGIDIVKASATSIALTSTVFALAHKKDLDSIAGTDLWLKSVAFGIAHTQGGWLAAVVAHMINNIRQNYLPAFSKLFSSTSGIEDFAMIVEKNRQLNTNPNSRPSFESKLGH